MSESAPKSLLALLVGSVFSMLISGALVIATAKAGISPGVSPLVVLLGWVFFGPWMRGRLKPFLALMQVTGSGGAAVSAGLIFTAPILQITARLMDQPTPDVNVLQILGSCIAGSLMGWGFVGLASRRFLTDPRLPAPEAVACDQLIRTAAQNPDDRPPVRLSLLPALVMGFLVQLLTTFKYLSAKAATASFHVVGLSKTGVATLPIPVSALYLGIGGLLTFPTAVLVFAGGLINAVTNAVAAETMPAGEAKEAFRWVGGAAMVMAVLFSLANYLWEGVQVKRSVATRGDEDLLTISRSMRVGLVGAILLGALILLAMLLSTLPVGKALALGGAAFLLISLLSGLGGLLSLQVGASASPVSGTVFMAMLVLSLAAIGLGLGDFEAIEVLLPVLVASCVAIAAANDSSQDYKTMQLNGFPVSAAFKGQLIGCLVGAVTTPFALWTAHNAFDLGSTAMPCPQASFFSTVLTSLFDPAKGVPWGPVCVGAALGAGAIVVELAGRARGVLLSSLAFAVGIYLPAEMGIGILCGNLARVAAARSTRLGSHRGILAAAGLIAGDALFSLSAGVLIVCGVPMSRFEAGATWPWWASASGLALMVGLLLFAFSDARAQMARQLKSLQDKE